MKAPARAGAGARTATGARLTYFAADERYVLAGPRAHVVEQVGQECRDTTGRTLTFFKATETLQVDSNADSRTRARTGGKCPELVP